MITVKFGASENVIQEPGAYIHVEMRDQTMQPAEHQEDKKGLLAGPHQQNDARGYRCVGYRIKRVHHTVHDQINLVRQVVGGMHFP